MIETQRLKLRRLTFQDAKFVLKLLNEPAYLENIGDKNVRDIADACEYLKSGPMLHYEKYDFGLMAVVLKSDETVIGMSGLLKRDVYDHPDIGYAFLRKYRRKGFAKEAALGVLDDAFQRLSIKKLLAITGISNDASAGLLRKIGFTQIDTTEYDGSENYLFEVDLPAG